jgi:hypothetical protein
LTPIHRQPAHRRVARSLTTLCAALLLPALSGCQGHKIVARINGEAITDEQYTNRLERITPTELDAMAQSAAGINIDAGGAALVNVIRDHAIDILAKQKNVTPSQESLDAMYNYQKLANPNLASLIKSGAVQEEDLKRNLRLQAEAIGIGTDGAHVDAKEFEAAYNAAKNATDAAKKIDIPEKYGMRLLKVKDMDDGQMALNRLKASGDFAAEAAREGDRPQLDGSEQVFPVADVQLRIPTLYDALKNLSAGQFVPAPLTLSVPQASGPATLTVVVQLTRKYPAHAVTLDEARPVLTTRLLADKFPQWQQHFAQSLAEFLRNANIEIDIDRYRPLITAFFKTPPQPTAGGAVSGGPEGAAGSGAPATGGAAGAGATAPPTGGKP